MINGSHAKESYFKAFMTKKNTIAIVTLASLVFLSILIALPAIKSALANPNGNKGAETPVEKQELIKKSLNYKSVDLGLDYKNDNNKKFRSNTKSNLESSYDNSPNLPELKDQTPFGSCWSFSAMSCIEADLISKKIADKSIDLSERQLAYNFFNKGDTPDPLNLITHCKNIYNPKVDISKETYPSYLDCGNNSLFAAWTLASWAGAVDEEKAKYKDVADYSEPASYTNVTPGYIKYLMLKDQSEGNPDWAKIDCSTWTEINNKYINTLAKYNLDPSLCFEKDDYHVQNINYVPMKYDAYGDVIKTEIKKRGAIGTAYFEDYKHYDEATNSLYDVDQSATNHSIAIVGWDDNVATKASKPGAWKVRNSWYTDGPKESHDGYFWISYYCSCFEENPNNLAFFYDAEKADNYDNNYQYDGTGNISGGVDLPKNQALSSKFTAKAADSESLDAVAFGIRSYNNSPIIDANVNVKVYKNTDPANPRPDSGSNVYNKDAYVHLAGYNTIKLDQSISLNKGDKFSVVITNNQDASIGFFLESNNNTPDFQIQFSPHFETGTNYWGYFNNVEWVWNDLCEDASKFNTRIKAFTTNNENRDISDASISDIEDVIYSGDQQSPKPNITYNGEKLIEGQDYVLTYEKNVDAGNQAKVYITGKGRYHGGPVSKQFTILPATLTAKFVDASIDYKQYSQWSPVVKVTGFVKKDEQQKPQGYVDPSVDKPDNVVPGQIEKLTPYGGTSTNNYKFEYQEGTLEIFKTNLVDASIDGIIDCSYDGTEHKQEPTVSYNGYTFVKDTDYELTYKNIINAGTDAKVIITAKGDKCFGQNTVTFKIDPADLSNCTIDKIKDSSYDGTEHKPTPDVYFNGKKLDPACDFNYEYKNNTHVGIAGQDPTVIVRGKGNYTKTNHAEFVIDKAKLDAEVRSDSIAISDYPGYQCKVDVAGFKPGDSSSTAEDYKSPTANKPSPVEPNKSYKVMPNNDGKARDYYFNLIEGTLTIEPLRDINNAVADAIDDVYYIGSAHLPEPVLRYQGESNPLVKGTDYIIDGYENNIHVGDNNTKPTIFIRGKGNYTGQKEVYFKILPATLTATYVGETVEYDNYENYDPSITVDGFLGIDKVQPAKGYVAPTVILPAKKDIRHGQEVTLTPSGGKADDYIFNNVGNLLKIQGNNINEASADAIPDCSYDTSEKCPEPVLKYKTDTNPLVKGVDYTLEYQDNLNVSDNAKVIIKASGIRFYGQKIVTFKIKPADIALATISEIKDSSYDGTEQKPTPDVYFNGVKLNPTSDYTSSYVNNKHVTSSTEIPTLTITGKGNFTGKNTAMFNIAQAKLDAAYRSAYVDLKEYDGYNPVVDISGYAPGDSSSCLDEVPVVTKPVNVKRGDVIELSPTGGIARDYYFNRIKGTLTIAPAKDINNLSLEEIKDASYSGVAQNPDPVLKDGEYKLQKDVDYSLAYEGDCTHVGTYQVSITGKNAYTGTRITKFNITKALLTATYFGDNIPFNDFDTYNPVVNVSDFVPGEDASSAKGYEAPVLKLPEKKDVKQGAEFTLEPKGGKAYDYSFKYVAGKLKINDGINIDPATVSPVDFDKDIYYDGSSKEPTPDVILAGTNLQKDKDYTLSYYNNVDAGNQAQLIIKGIGNYTGSKTVNFTIHKAKLTATYQGATIHYLDFDNYNPVINVSGFAPGEDASSAKGYEAPKVDKPTDEKSGTDYKLTPYGGKADNYEFAKYEEGILSIKALDASEKTVVNAKIELKDSNNNAVHHYTYAGPDGVKPLKDVMMSGKLMRPDKDYTFRYDNNVNVGEETALLTVTGKGEFEGAQEIKFSITKAKLRAIVEDANVNIKDYDKYQPKIIYDGFIGKDAPGSAKGWEEVHADKPDKVEAGRTYKIKPYGGAADNYALEYCEGTLTVVKDQPTPTPQPSPSGDAGSTAQTSDANIAIIALLIIASLLALTVLIERKKVKLHK